MRPHAEAGKVDLVTAGGLRPELRQGILAEADFARDEKIVEAVCFALVVIGEAATNVPDDVQARHRRSRGAR